MVKTQLFLLWFCVRSQVGELRSHKLDGAAKKNKKQKKNKPKKMSIDLSFGFCISAITNLYQGKKVYILLSLMPESRGGWQCQEPRVETVGREKY